ncbi:MAG: sugar transferase [Deltaproteobacteria bacterium]|nr:sugar transferase [Deltaproteobacteria bacterium]
MLKQRAKTLNYLSRTLDVAVIVVSFFIAYFLRNQISWLPPLRPLNEYLQVPLIAAPLWALFLTSYGAYESGRKKRYLQTLWLITRASVTAMMVLFSLLFITDADYVSRLFIVFFGLVAVVLLLCGRIAIMMALRFIRRQGFNYRNILIAGTGKRARMYAEMICSHTELGLRIFGYVDDEPSAADREILGSKLVGTLAEVPSILAKNVIDEVVIALPRSWLSQAEEIVRLCEETGIEVTIVADFFDIAIAKLHTTMFYDIPLLTFSTTPAQHLQLLLKNCLDRIGAIMLLILALPVFILAALAIKMTSPGPVFFRQTRVGLNGRKFRIYKFRSMEVRAEEKLETLRTRNEMDGPVFKMRDDPRVTWVGSILRRTSVDELPQLMNVLRGEMSLVGPRPALPSEIDLYDRWQRRRLSVKPGITCLWQVNGRSNINFNEWMNLDLFYIDHWSLALDLHILLKTFIAVVKGKGAF